MLARSSPLKPRRTISRTHSLAGGFFCTLPGYSIVRLSAIPSGTRKQVPRPLRLWVPGWVAALSFNSRGECNEGPEGSTSTYTTVRVPVYSAWTDLAHPKGVHTVLTTPRNSSDSNRDLPHAMRFDALPVQTSSGIAGCPCCGCRRLPSESFNSRHSFDILLPGVQARRGGGRPVQPRSKQVGQHVTT